MFLKDVFARPLKYQPTFSSCGVKHKIGKNRLMQFYSLEQYFQDFAQVQIFMSLPSSSADLLPLFFLHLVRFAGCKNSSLHQFVLTGCRKTAVMGVYGHYSGPNSRPRLWLGLKLGPRTQLLPLE